MIYGKLKIFEFFNVLIKNFSKNKYINVLDLFIE